MFVYWTKCIYVNKQLREQQKILEKYKKPDMLTDILVLHDFKDPPSPLKIEATCKKNIKTRLFWIFCLKTQCLELISTKNSFFGKVKSQCLELIKMMFFMDYPGIWCELLGLNDGFRFF